MNIKDANYIQEPTFLSPLDIHFRMMGVKRNDFINEFPKLMNENVQREISKEAFNAKETVYTLKRTK